MLKTFRVISCEKKGKFNPFELHWLQGIQFVRKI